MIRERVSAERYRPTNMNNSLYLRCLPTEDAARGGPQAVARITAADKHTAEAPMEISKVRHEAKTLGDFIKTCPWMLSRDCVPPAILFEKRLPYHTDRGAFCCQVNLGIHLCRAGIPCPPRPQP